MRQKKTIKKRPNNKRSKNRTGKTYKIEKLTRKCPEVLKVPINCQKMIKNLERIGEDTIKDNNI